MASIRQCSIYSPLASALIYCGVFFLFFIISVGSKPVDGIIDLNENASTTLLNIDKSLTSSMLSLASTQINDSQFSGPDALLDRDMAIGTISDLVFGLSISGDSNANSNETETCSDATSCLIVDLNSALDFLKLNQPKKAQEILLHLLSQVDQKL